MKPPLLTDLPEETLLLVLSFLHVSDLLQCTRVCHLLRGLATDPILHAERLQWASRNLRRQLSCRRSKAAISPPNAWIWLSQTYMLSRSIGKSLIKIRLSHNLEQRPSTRDLIARAILPSYATSVSPMLVQSQRAVHKNRLKDTLCRKLERRPSMNSLVCSNIIPEECAKRTVSPLLVETRRRVMKESLKDGLRAWLENRGLKAQQQRVAESNDTERVTVKLLVRRLTARKLAQESEDKIDSTSLEKKRAQARWGRALEAQRLQDETKRRIRGTDCLQPTRAHVLNLKRWWEGVISAATA